MKVLLNYFKSYFSTQFHWLTHLLVLLFIFGVIGINEYFDFFRKFLQLSEHSLQRTFRYVIMNSLAFIGPVILISIFQTKDRIIANKKYLVYGFLGVLLISLDSSYYTLKYLDQIIPHEHGYGFYYSCISNLGSLFSIVIPLVLVYFTTRHFKPEFYGVNINKASIKSYLILASLLIPIVFIAASGEDFLRYYPSYKYQSVHISGWTEWMKVLTFESCYGFDFFAVELMFRGYMVVALSRFAGKEVILPMVSLYAVLHFGKPMLEIISSVFGGFALGVMSYKSRNIYGGLIVHLGVAWGMELAAFLLLNWSFG